MSDSKTLIREDVAGFLALVNSLPPPEALIAEEQRAGYLAMKAMTQVDIAPTVAGRGSCRAPKSKVGARSSRR